MASAEPDEDAADRGAEALAEADRDGVELPAVVADRHAGGDVGVEEPRPVEVHRDAALAGDLARATDLVERLHRAAAEVVGVLDDHERRAHLVGADAGDHERCGVVGTEAAALGDPGARRDAREHRGRAELGPHDVGEGVADELLARLDVQPHAELVGHRARRA